jgi:hypothetical protein
MELLKRIDSIIKDIEYITYYDFYGVKRSNFKNALHSKTDKRMSANIETMYKIYSCNKDHNQKDIDISIRAKNVLTSRNKRIIYNFIIDNKDNGELITSIKLSNDNELDILMNKILDEHNEKILYNECKSESSTYKNKESNNSIFGLKRLKIFTSYRKLSSENSMMTIN